MELGYSGRAAVVTDGTSGIRFAAMKLWSAEGAEAAVCSSGGDRLSAARAEFGGGRLDRGADRPEPHLDCTSAARSGVHSLLKSWAPEFAPDVWVNSIIPALADPGQWPPRFDARAEKSKDISAWSQAVARGKGIPVYRLGLPDEVARDIFFLGSPVASHITGVSQEVSGGVLRYIL